MTSMNATLATTAVTRRSSETYWAADNAVVIRLCAQCVNALELDKPADTEVRSLYNGINRTHHTSMQSFFRAVKDECFFCAQLWRQRFSPPSNDHGKAESLDVLIARLPLIHEIDSFISISSIHDGDKSGPEIFMWLDIKGDIAAVLHVEPQTLIIVYGVVPVADRSPPLTETWTDNNIAGQVDDLDLRIAESRPTTHSRLSREASRWFRECIKEHSHCGHERQQLWKPKRLLKMPSCSNDGLCHLVETSGLPEQHAYATLSHRWGMAEFLKLTRDNHTELQQGFELTRLPPTFQDALSVCQTLNIDYIWIDSICIMQDDATDWTEQSMDMSKVYMNGIVNIAAADNTSSESMFGLLGQTHHLRVDGTQGLRSILGLSDGRYVVYDRGFWIESVHVSPLNERGWVLQERILSPRTLHFTTDKIFWECCTKRCSLDFPYGIPEYIGISTPKISRLAVTQNEEGGTWSVPNFEPPIIRMDEIYPQHGASIACRPRDCWLCQTWRRWVNILSHCELTFATDRPFAVAGLVDHIGQLMGLTYYAGLWGGHLERQLCWYVSGDRYHPLKRHSGIRDGQHTFPSWSWLSVDAPVVFQGEGVSLLYYVMEVNIEPPRVHVDRTIQQHGWMRLRADMVPIHFQVSQTIWTLFDATIELDGHRFEVQMMPDLVRADSKSSSEPGMHYFVPLFCADDLDGTSLQGLVVELVNGEDLTYRKVGTVVSCLQQCLPSDPILTALAACRARFVDRYINVKGKVFFLI